MTHSDGVGLFITSGRASRWCFHTPSTEGKKGEATRQISTSSNAKRVVLALFLIAMSTDLELLPLKGRHRAPEDHSGPYIKQTYL